MWPNRNLKYYFNPDGRSFGVIQPNLNPNNNNQLTVPNSDSFQDGPKLALNVPIESRLDQDND